MLMAGFRFPMLLQAASRSAAAACRALLQQLVPRGVFKGSGAGSRGHLVCLLGGGSVAGVCIGMQHDVASSGLVSVLLWGVRACELRSPGSCMQKQWQKLLSGAWNSSWQHSRHAVNTGCVVVPDDAGPGLAR